MAAKRIAQSSINWAAIAERVPENQKVLLTAFKAKSDGYLRRVLANPETAPKIDWAYYKARVAVSGMVDSFQKQYDAVKAGKVQEYIKSSNDRISGFQSEVQKLRALLPYDQMTMEDYRDAFPDQALDPINRPTFWPHTPEEQVGARSTESTGH
ncbi:hypothetical protein B566_EDAN012888 [Ephemera danica]|nr:hypothetical protein B566_EDAN012888 [Ephemera danica]